MSIEAGYHDAFGAWHPLSPSTRAAIEAAMGGEGRERAARARVRVVREGESLDLAPGAIILEDGSSLEVGRSRLPRLPLGYHEYRPASGEPDVRLIVSPGRCALPLLGWGWTVQLYATRSAASWGIGDLGDLRDLGRWASALGASFIMLNPLHAALPVLQQQPSPYYPSSRIYRNPLYLRVEEVPGAHEAGLGLERLAAAGRDLNRNRLIDRDAIYRLKLDGLERLWRHFPGSAAFERYLKEQGTSLLHYATFCALVERFGGDQRSWDAGYRHPQGSAVAPFRAAERDRVAFHSWLQWLLDEQLARAAGAIPLIQDLPVGFDPGGADGWIWQDVLAPGVSVGAPPDEFNRLGQDWGVPPFAPAALLEMGYEPFVQTIRATLRHAAGIRIDHVMGLFRLFLIPAGASPEDGAYMRYPADDLLAIVALESHRAQAFVIGEDLGTVGEGVRERLAHYGLLSSRVLWFEPGPPESYPEMALATISTHDLPTIAGMWTGAEFQMQQSLGLEPARQSYEEARERLRAVARAADDTPVAAVIEGAYRALGRAPSALLAASLEDALAVSEKPNAPGAPAGYPSWSLALPEPLEALERTPLSSAIARALNR